MPVSQMAACLLWPSCGGVLTTSEPTDTRPAGCSVRFASTQSFHVRLPSNDLRADSEAHRYCFDSQIVVEQLDEADVLELAVVLTHHHRPDVWLAAIVVRPLRAFGVGHLPSDGPPASDSEPGGAVRAAKISASDDFVRHSHVRVAECLVRLCREQRGEVGVPIPHCARRATRDQQARRHPDGWPAETH